MSSRQYKSLRLVVARDNFRVKQSIVTEPSGNINRFEFFEPNTARPPKNGLFYFNVKTAKNYRIVRSKP